MNKFIKLVVGMAAGAALFIHQDAGVNLAILGIILGALSLYPFRVAQIKALAFDISLYLIALLSFAWYGDEISFSAIWMSFFCLQIRIHYAHIHWFPAFITVFLNCVTTPVRFWFFNKWMSVNTAKPNLLKIIYLGVLPAIILILFSIIYAVANHDIAQFFEKLFVTTTIFKILFISFLVFLVLFNAWFLMFLPKFDEINTIFQEKYAEPSNTTHRVYFAQSGIITFILLSILSILLIILQSKDLISNIHPAQFSTRLHGSVAALIISLLMAIGVVLIYFKNQIQASSSKNQLCIWAYFWLALNAILVLIACVQNTQYVQYYGFTFQRLGVFIFLLLSTFGLLLSVFKIKNQYNNAYVLNRFLRSAIIVLILSAPINFSYYITQFNLKYAQKVDINYLYQLEFNNELLVPYLQKSTQSNDQELFKLRFEQIKTKKQESFLSQKLYYKSLPLIF